MSDTLDPEPQAICGFTAEDYWRVMADLLPPGVVWPREPDTDLQRTLSGLAIEFSRVHERDCDLLAEAYPPTAIETIPDWERICGLPDPCVDPPPSTLQERRDAIMAKLAARGGQSRQYFIEGAARLGYDITITEYRPMLAGQARAGDRCYHQSNGRSDTYASRMGDWWFVWHVHCAQTTKIVYFRANLSTAGEPLMEFGNNALECWILENKPAHTWVNFSYGADPGQPQPPPPTYWDTTIGDGSIWDGGSSLWDGMPYPRRTADALAD